MDSVQISWDSALESGIPVIDYEHKELVEQLAALMDESRPDRVEAMLRFLKDYVVKHFAHEQVMHKSSGYPKAAEHKQAHTNFVNTFLDLEDEYFEKGSNSETLQKLTTVVSDWLLKHIMGQDMEFAEYYKAMIRKARPGGMCSPR